MVLSLYAAVDFVEALVSDWKLFWLEPFTSLKTGGRMTRQSSPALMNPSRESYLCWLNCTFWPT